MSTELQTMPQVEAPPEPKLLALMGEFDDVTAVVGAARKVRAAGYARFDVHSPFPIHGIDHAMGIRPTILPWIVLACGLSGCVGGLILTWWANASAVPVPFMSNLQGYQFLISGKPIWSLPANIPVIFETTVLLSAFGAVFGMLILNRLPMLYNPLFRSERFKRVTSDRFFLVIDAGDEKFNEEQTGRMLRDLGAAAIERIED